MKAKYIRLTSEKNKIEFFKAYTYNAYSSLLSSFYLVTQFSSLKTTPLNSLTFFYCFLFLKNDPLSAISPLIISFLYSQR